MTPGHGRPPDGRPAEAAAAGPNDVDRLDDTMSHIAITASPARRVPRCPRCGAPVAELGPDGGRCDRGCRFSRAAFVAARRAHQGAAPEPAPSPAPEAMADVARTVPTDELMAIADALRAETQHWQVLPDLDEESRAVALILSGDRLAAVEAELARRERLARTGVCRSPSADRDYAAWRRLAAELRERVDCRDLLAREAGWQPVRQGAREAAGPCPVCAGRDRFVAWADRCWCRRCGWSGDAVALARAIWRCSFREAIERLAGVAR